jgi:hypothetical protein
MRRGGIKGGEVKIFRFLTPALVSFIQKESDGFLLPSGEKARMRGKK